MNGTASTGARGGIAETLVTPVFVGVVILLAGTLPRNVLFFANLRYYPSLPWSVPLIAGWIWLFWRYLGGAGPPSSTAAWRAASLRAKRLALSVWLWSLSAGTLGLVALVLALRLLNRVVALPQQTVPDLGGVSTLTVAALLVVSAPVAGIVEESAFRGYMQGPIERRYGLAPAILITGTAFALAHLDFTPALWPYYVAVAALYGAITYVTGSILPAVVLHTGGNLYSNFDLWLHGQAEWQTPAGSAASVWQSGIDGPFLADGAAFAIAATAMLMAFRRLLRATRAPSMAPPSTGS